VARQGILQAAGELAAPQRLRQHRKSKFVEADCVTLTGRQYRGARQGESVEVPPESNKIVACRKRSEEMKETTPEESESPTMNTGDLVAIHGRQMPLGVCPDQLTEGRAGCREESDPFVVVRDGRTDHMAKGWAERQSEQRTDPGRRMLPIRVSSSLLAFGVGVSSIGRDADPVARLSEEPCAGKPHAGICEGGTR
jgi:hypothetical protein